MFVLVVTFWNVAHFYSLCRGKVIITLHSIVSVCIYFDICIFLNNSKSINRFNTTHVLSLIDVRKFVVSNLSVSQTSVDVVGRSSNHYVSVTRNTIHFIVFSFKCEELSWKEFLEYMSKQLCS